MVTLEMPSFVGARVSFALLSSAPPGGGGFSSGVFSSMIVDGSVELLDAVSAGGPYGAARFVLAPEFMVLVKAIKDAGGTW